jgi:hypothetical protein
MADRSVGSGASQNARDTRWSARILEALAMQWTVDPTDPYCVAELPYTSPNVGGE